MANRHDSDAARASAPQQIRPQRPWLWIALAEVLLILGVFFMHGAWPTPDSNETHYLTKAKHYWDPGAFANDYFVDTGDAHGVFFFLFGWLTLWLSLDATAWVGRISVWLCLAIAWRGLSRAVIPKNWVAVLSAALLVMLTEQTHMAGEWIIGGVEGKGFSYVFVLWALRCLVLGRWNFAWVLAGAAMSLHMVVGGWTLVCLGVVWLIVREGRPPIRAMLPGLAIGALLALPGLWFGLSLTRGADSEIVAQANVIQVFERLPHHLMPMQFKEGFIPRHLLLWPLFLLLCGIAPVSAGDRRLRWFVGATMLLALVGFAFAGLAVMARGGDASAFACSVLRYYWFRLADIMLPLGVTLVGLQYVVVGLAEHPHRRRWWLAALVAVSSYDLARQTEHFPAPLNPCYEVVPPRPDRRTEYLDWLAVCDWAAQTPPGTRFLTPRTSITFKWHSGRDEVATMKDMPQDAQSVVQWWNRLLDIWQRPGGDPNRRWYRTLAERGHEEIQRLGKKYSADYVIVEKHPDVPPLAERSIYENASYAVYPVEQTED